MNYSLGHAVPKKVFQSLALTRPGQFPVLVQGQDYFIRINKIAK